MKIYIYLKGTKRVFLVTTLVLCSVGLVACQNVRTIERDDSNQVIQEEFTQSAVALTDELDQYTEIDEFFIEDEEDNTLDQQVRKYLIKDREVKSHGLNLETMDLKLYMDEQETAYFLAVMKDERDNPNTLFGIIKKEADGKYSVAGEHLAAYFVNLPKTYLLTHNNEWALVSQRPFSTFEECYFFRLDKDNLKLYMRGWEDPSLNYYGKMTDLLNDGKIDEAMALPDDSMYPMGYEESLFKTANLMVAVSEKKALEKEKQNHVDQALSYLDWSLNYYFENHYGTDLITLFKDNFKPLGEGTKDDFGYTYILPKETLEPILRHYANLVAKQGLEKEAMGYQKAIDKYFGKK